MKQKTIQIQLPDFIDLVSYKHIIDYKGTQSSERMLNTIAAILKKNIDTVKDWPVSIINQVSDDISELAFAKEQFHALVEFDDVLYGYAHINQMSLGEYVDLEKYLKDYSNSLPAIAAILYRPVTQNRFKSMKFHVKQGIKTAFNKGITNPFEYYDVEKYDSKKRKERESQFESFPAHILNGAIAFFLTVGSLYLTDIAYSKKKMSKMMKKLLDNQILEGLSQSIGHGGEPSTIFLSPTSYRSQAIQV